MTDELTYLQDRFGLEELRPIHDGGICAVYSGMKRANGSPTIVARIAQVVRLSTLDPTTREEVIAQINDRVEKLVGTLMPYVSPVFDSDVRPNGDFYSVRAEFGQPLKESIRDHEAHPRASKDIEQFVEELLTGLAALHKFGISHGNLCLKNIQTNGSSPNQPVVPWIAGVEVGGLAYWTKDSNYWGDNQDAKYCFPPETDGRPPAPSPKADLYALGILICQFAGGRKVIELPSLREKATAKIKSQSVRRLVMEHLLAVDPLDRLESADAAIRKLQLLKMSQIRRGYLPIIFGAAVLLAVSLTAYSRHVAAKNDLIAQLERKNITLEQDNSTLQEENAKQRTSLLHQGQSIPLPTESSLLERDAATIFNELVKKQIDPSDSESWLMNKLVQRSEADRGKLIGKVKAWQGGFAGSSSFKLRVNEATSTQNQGNNWLLTMYVNGTEVDREYFTSGIQPSANPPTLAVPWKKGDVIQIILEGDWSWYYPTRSNLIDATYSGPYSIWDAHKAGQGLSSNDTTLRFEIQGCPGPPPPKPSSSIPIIGGIGQESQGSP